MILHFILRKLKIEDLVLEALAGGLKQLVIVAGGSDTLGLRLASQYPDLHVYEIDHPATQAIKQRCLREQQIMAPSNFSLLPVDLTQQTLAATLLLNKNFDFNVKTIFIAEGLFMYLPLDAVGSTLDIIKKFPQSTAQFIFTYMLLDKKGRPNFNHQSQRVNQWLARKKEPFIWGFSPEKMDQYLLQRSLVPGKHIDDRALSREYIKTSLLSKFPVAVGENITSVS